MQRRRLIECDASRHDEKKVYLGMPSMYCSYIPDQFSEVVASLIDFDRLSLICDCDHRPFVLSTFDDMGFQKSKMRVWVSDDRYVYACTALALFWAGVFSRNARFLFGK